MIVSSLGVKELDLMIVKERIMIIPQIRKNNKIVYLKLIRLIRLMYLRHKFDMPKQLKMRLNN
jgi:hypothetical protein